MILIILQNAWYENGKTPKYEKWLVDLWHSHTGKRLIEMIPEGIPYFIINASPYCGVDASSYAAASPRHIKKWFKYSNPKVVLACGKIAQAGCRAASLDFVPAPHPAYRRLSKDDTAEIRRQLKEASA
jgi:hypothetical protein